MVCADLLLGCGREMERVSEREREPCGRQRTAADVLFEALH